MVGLLPNCLFLKKLDGSWTRCDKLWDRQERPGLTKKEGMNNGTKQCYKH